MRHDRRRVVSTPAVDVLRARLSGAPSSRRRSLYCIIEDTAEVDMDDPFRRIVPGEGAQIPKPPTVRQIDRATTRQKRSLTAELPASTFRRATHIVPTSPSPSLPRLPEDVSEVNVGGTFGHGEDVQRPQPLRITPVARPATSQKPSFTLRPPPRNPRRITHAIPPSPSSPTRAPATVRFQTDERPVSRPLRPETSAVSGRRPRSSILSATSTVTSTAASAYPSSYAEDHIWPAVNIVPPTYPPSLHSIYSEDLATPSTSRTRESADTEWTRPLRDPPRRSAWRSSQTAPSPSTATSFLEHPFATNPPVSPRSANTRVKVVLPSPSTSARFPSRPPPFIQDDKPRPASRNEQTDRPPRILSRTFFKAGFLFPPIWLLGALFLCMKPPDTAYPSASMEERGDNPTTLASYTGRAPSTTQGHVTVLRKAELKWGRRSLVAFAVFCLLLSIALGLYLSFGPCYRSCHG